MRRALEPADYPFFDYRRFTFSLGITTGKGVWLSGSTAVRYDSEIKRMVVSGDLVEQAGVVHDKMARTLAAGNLGTGDIIRLVQYVTPSAINDLPRLAEFHATKFGDKSPLISTIIVKRLLREDALIEIEAIASANGMSTPHHMPTVSAVSCEGAWHAADAQLQKLNYARNDALRTLEIRSTASVDGLANFSNPHAGALATIIVPCLADLSQGVQIEMTVSCERPTGISYAVAVGNPEEGGIVEQARLAYKQLGTQLQKAGLDFSHVVKTTEFITPEGLAAYRDTADIRREVFTQPFPAATGVICERLPQTGSQIVVEAVALRESL